MALSGMLISFQPQIVEWAERDLRIVNPPGTGAPRLSLDALVAKASEASPKGRPRAVTLNSDPAASIAVAFGKEGGNIYLDPYSGKALGGESKAGLFLKKVENWHRWFGSKKIGQPITGAACLFFFFLLLSGLYLWWPRNRTRAGFRSAATPIFKLKGKAREWNWHTTVGLWAAPLLLVTTLTGTLIAYRWANDFLFILTGNEPPPKPPEEGKRAGGKEGRKEGMPSRDAVPGASLDSLWAKAESQVPLWSSINLRFPQKPGGPFTAAIIEPGFSRRYARSMLTLNAATAEVIKWEPYSEQNLGRRLRSWIVPVHTGRAVGAPGQLAALLSACAAALLIWTGASMAFRRFSKPNSRGKTRGNIGVTVNSE